MKNSTKRIISILALTMALVILVSCAKTQTAENLNMDVETRANTQIETNANVQSNFSNEEISKLILTSLKDYLCKNEIGLNDDVIKIVVEPGTPITEFVINIDSSY